MNRGYVRLWRKSLDAGWLKNHKLWVFWSYCLLKATHKEFDAIVGLQIVHLLPGQFVFGLRVAAKETGLTIREIRTIIDFLRKAGNLTIKTTNKFSVITIINWHIYQSKESENDTLNDKQVANKGQHTRTEEHKKKIYPSNGDFETFWKAYPKKRSKDAARQAWEKRQKDIPSLEAILLAVETQKQTSQWQENGGKFIPYPATWLYGGRWADEVEPVKTAEAW